MKCAPSHQVRCVGAVVRHVRRLPELHAALCDPDAARWGPRGRNTARKGGVRHYFRRMVLMEASNNMCVLSLRKIRVRYCFSVVSVVLGRSCQYAHAVSSSTSRGRVVMARQPRFLCGRHGGGGWAGTAGTLLRVARLRGPSEPNTL